MPGYVPGFAVVGQQKQLQHQHRLEQLRQMPFHRLRMLVQSGKAGPLAVRVFNHRRQQQATMIIGPHQTAKRLHKTGVSVLPTPKTRTTPPDHSTMAGPHKVPGPKQIKVGGNNHQNGGGGGSNFMKMLTNLLGQSDTNQSLPTSLADKIAGADTAMASGFQDQLSHLPAAKKAALASIANWFGQVTKAEGTAANRDQSMAQAGSSAIRDATKGIADSLGGSAMAGAGEIGAMGSNDANTLSAIGANDKMLASDLGPIFALAKANASNSRSQQYDQAKADLQNSLAQAQGQAETDRGNALLQILQANNASRQTNFGNQAGLLNTLASLQISGMNAASQAQERQIMNAYHLSQIQKNSGKSQGGISAMTPTELSDFVNKIVSGLVDPNTHKLTVSWPQALRMARNSARSAGMNPMNKQVIQTVIGPALSNAGITGQGGGFWPAIYQP